MVAKVDTAYIKVFEKRNPELLPSCKDFSTFPNKFEKFFSDRLWGRFHLLRTLAEIKFASNTSLNPDRVLIGKDKWLFMGNREIILRHRNLLSFKSKDGTTPKLFSKKMIELQQWCLGQGTILLLAMPPRKHDIYPEYLPHWVNAKANAPNAMETLMESLIKMGVNYVDLRKVLMAGKKMGQLYYPLDMHWNSLGALLAFQTITQEAYRIRQMPWKPLQFQIEEKEGGKRGLADMVYMSRLPQSEINITTSPPLDTYDLCKEGKIYRESSLSEIRNGDVPIEAINPNKPHAPTAIWLRDSFGDAATPFLMQYFSRVFVYDYRTGRPYNESPLRIDMLVRDHHPDFLFLTANETRGFGELTSMLNVSLPYFFDFVPMNLNHGVWINGVDKDRLCFVVRKTSKNDVALKEGTIIEFAASGQRRILRRNITPDGDYLIVFVDGDTLDPQGDGWPQIFTVLQ